jgi:AAA15 family ATPase/GTPase
MIREFWVKNYFSIRDKQGINFLVKGPSSALVTEVADGVFLYKLGILYGSNASGKSNMLIALNEVFRLLILPKLDAADEIIGCIPFALTPDKPTEMHVSFYANAIRYDYDVAFTAKSILKESLNYYPKNSKALFYERTFVGENVQAEIKFGASLKLQAKTQQSIRENTLNNHSVLSVCRKMALTEDIKQFNVLHKWLMEHYHDVEGNKDRDRIILAILKEANSAPNRHKFFQLMLQKADLNIVDYKHVIERMDYSEESRECITGGKQEKEHKKLMESINFVNHSVNGDFEIPINWQSEGTLKYIRILDVLYDLITDSHVYCLDELGENLHYDLLFYFLNVFLYNSDKSQLIITSQETALLSQDLINENRGAVWFVEKNRETASSEYSRGDSFGLHKNLSLYNSYSIGRLGAKPELGSIFINWED